MEPCYVQNTEETLNNFKFFKRKIFKGNEVEEFQIASSGADNFYCYTEIFYLYFTFDRKLSTEIVYNKNYIFEGFFLLGKSSRNVLLNSSDVNL